MTDQRSFAELRELMTAIVAKSMSDWTPDERAIVRAYARHPEARAATDRARGRLSREIEASDEWQRMIGRA